MSDNAKIPLILAALSERAKVQCSWASAQIVGSSSGWVGCCTDLKIWSDGHADPMSALAAIDRALAKREDRDGSLARTLGIEVAA